MKATSPAELRDAFKLFETLSADDFPYQYARELSTLTQKLFVDGWKLRKTVRKRIIAVRLEK